MGDIAVYTVLEGAGFLMAIADEQDFLGCHDGADAYCKGLLGNKVEVAFEEAAVGVDGVGGQRLNAGLAGEGRAGFVEGEMAVGAYSSHEEVDAAGCLDGFLIVLTFLDEVGSIAVEDVDVLGLDVNM